MAKIVDKVGYLTCCAISVEISEEVLPPNGDDERLIQVLKNVSDVVREHDTVGCQPQGKLLLCLFDAKKRDVAKQFYASITAKNIPDVVQVAFVKQPCYIDKRYLEGTFRGAGVSLPPLYLQDRILSLLDNYCHEWRWEQEPRGDIIEYIGELGGGRTISVIIQGGSERLAVGMNKGTLRTTDHVSTHYKRMLDDIEKEVLEWCESHPSISKIGAKA